MLEIIKAGGWVMWPLLLCSVISLSIIAERFWTLREKRIAPKNLVAQIWHWEKTGHLDLKRIADLRRGSPLGRILAAGLVNRKHDREIMKESIEEVGRHVAHDLGRFLDILGTITAISPLLGLLGTVLGMIHIFTAITAHGVGDPNLMAGGIAEALIATVAGLSIAIPSMFFYRYFHARVDDLVITMEQEAFKLVEIIQGLREHDISN
ncbi:MAG: MotA/TolQ/ExbB proton channel family protein [Gammaproteobacteria bacterium]|nr:MotA/TolQ/ExbB proton channel family protein [Gammaproteobacteria bacterium]